MTYLVLVHASEEIEPGHRTIRFNVDSIVEGIKEIRSFLAKRGIAGEWGVILDSRNGNIRGRYVTDNGGMVQSQEL